MKRPGDAGALAFDRNGSFALWKASRAGSVPRVTRGARKRNDVAHVGESRHVRDRAFEAEPEPGMRHSAVPAQVAIPAVMRGIEAGLDQASVEHVEPLLALAAADDLADSGRE